MPAQSYNITRTGPNPWYYTEWNGNVVNMGNFLTTLKYIDKLTISSISASGWKQLNKRQRSVIRHNYSKTLERHKAESESFIERGITPVSGQPSRTTVYTKSWAVDCFFQAGYWPDPGPSNSTWKGGDLSREVDNKLLSKLANENQSSSLLVTLAEAHKTANHVAKTATRLAEALRALRKCRFGDFTRALGITATYKQEVRFGRKKKKVLYDLHMNDPRNGHMEATFRSNSYQEQRALTKYGQRQEFQKFMADTWLEYSYGWKPLLMEVNDSMKAVAKHCVERQNVLLSVIATAAFENPEVNVTSKANGYDVRFQRIENRKERLIVNYYKPESVLNALNNFGVLNPLEVAWELIPFSFVVDWFIPVGDAIRNLTSTVGLLFHGGVRTRHTKATATTTVYANGIPYAWNGVGSSMVCSGSATKVNEQFLLTRTVLNSFPNPTMPSLKDPRSIAHGLSAISLLSNLFLTGSPGSNRNLRT